MKRLFFALWPDEQIREQIQGVLQQLSCTPLKLTTLSNLHVTLVFLGQVHSIQEQQLIAEAQKLLIPDMQLVFDLCSFWKKPGILCLTNSQAFLGAGLLVEQLSTIASNLGIVVDEREYTPHITLARKAHHTVSLDFAPIIWRANSFCLLESCSEPNGVVYRLREVFV